MEKNKQNISQEFIQSIGFLKMSVNKFENNNTGVSITFNKNNIVWIINNNGETCFFGIIYTPDELEFIIERCTPVNPKFEKTIDRENKSN